MNTFPTLKSLGEKLGQEVAVTEWVTITQERINLFADATDDHQWIHLDRERAKAGPFGATIAHGFLTLSLVPMFLKKAMTIEDQRMGVNYGLNKVRFPSPVLVDSELRARLVLKEFEPLDESGAQCTMSVTIERRGSEKPVCVAECVSRHYI
ncbi:MAG: MaoC family dehydratase [Burkholderiaceae bacterium]